MSKTKENPVGATEMTDAAVGANPVAEQGVNDELLKLITDEVKQLLDTADSNLKGESFDTIEAALSAAEADDPYFNPTLSQYREGLCFTTNRNVSRVKKVPVGKGNRKAWCIICPAGYKKDGKVNYTQAFYFYPSTLRKQIQRTDEVGDPILDENMKPIMVPADNTSNQVWREARAITDSRKLLEYALDHDYECSEIIRDFGPSVFVQQEDGTNKAKSHKLTSVPMFNRK